jgi:C1A family cysteine protease
VRAFGVPLQAQMPNTFGVGMDKIADPGDDIIAAARSRRQVFTHLISGRDNATRLQNILQVLNEGVPVAIGLRWPHWRTLHQPLLSNQPTLAGYMHAVTLVGYTVDEGRRDTLRFIFRNSWGMQWGVGGYGFATWDYLQANLLDAVVIEVRPRRT